MAVDNFAIEDIDSDTNTFKFELGVVIESSIAVEDPVVRCE